MKTLKEALKFIAPLLAIIIILLSGGVAYVYLYKNKQNPKPASVVLIAQSTSPVQVLNSQNSDWHTYNNNMYSFTLTFPDAWEGYRVKESPSAVWFGIKKQDQVFGVAVYTKQEFEKIKKEVADYGSPISTHVIAENSTHIFTQISAQDYADDVIDLANLKQSIISTFKFK